MGTNSSKIGAFAVLSLLALAACDTATGNSQDSAASRAEFRGEIPPEVYQMGLANGIAEQIANECPSLRHNYSELVTQMKTLSEQLKAKGYRESDMRYLARNLPKKRVQDDAIKFIQASGIVFGEPETFCTAGRREIANGTAIGAFLKG